MEKRDLVLHIHLGEAQAKASKGVDGLGAKVAHRQEDVVAVREEQQVRHEVQQGFAGGVAGAQAQAVEVLRHFEGARRRVLRGWARTDEDKEQEQEK